MGALLLTLGLVACVGTTNAPETQTEQTTSLDVTQAEANTTAETTFENEFDKWYSELESGEWPEACIIDIDSSKDVSIDVDEVYEMPYIAFAINADRYQSKYQQGPEYYQFDVIVDDPDILEIVNIDKDKLMNYEIMDGGLTIKGLAPGETKITLVMTYLPTGGVYSVSTDVTVSAMYQYQAYPDDATYVSLCDGEPRTVVDPMVCDGVELADYLVNVSSGATYEDLISLTVIAFENGRDPADACTIEVTAKETNLVEIVSVDEQRLMGGYSDGVTLKTLAAGTAHIYITFTNTASGQSSTLQMVLVIEDETSPTQ